MKKNKEDLNYCLRYKCKNCPKQKECEKEQKKNFRTMYFKKKVKYK